MIPNGRRHILLFGETVATWLPAVMTGWLLGHIGSDDLTALVETPVGQLACLLAAFSLLLIGSVIYAWRHAVGLRDEFLTIASHELRTPLASLQLAVENMTRMVGRKQDAPERMTRKLQVCLVQIDRLTTFVDGLLEAPDISGRRLTLKRVDTDAVVVVRQVLKKMAPRAYHAHCVVEPNLLESLPGRFDAERLEQAASHLLDNAIKYGAGKPIVVSLALEHETLVLSVADKGMGIAPEDLTRIFERFERAVSVQYFGGMGLGLYIVREIAAAHGGRVEVTSEVGQGSCFRLMLPRLPRQGWSQRGAGRK